MKKYTLEKFNYEEYLEKQKYRARRKWGNTKGSIKEFKDNILSIWNHIDIHPKSVIGCMGIRNGDKEFSLFKELLPNSEIIGVDICNEVVNIGGLCLDFNKLPKDWNNKFDLLFSNSIDHSFNIEKTLKEWRRVTKKGGLLFLIFSKADVGYADLYSFNIKDVKKLMPKVKIILETDTEIFTLEENEI